MAQFYKLSIAPAGTTVTAVLDTTTGTITYTATMLSGLSSSVTTSSSQFGYEVAAALTAKLKASGGTEGPGSSDILLRQLGNATATVHESVIQQAKEAPPDVNETQAIPTNSTVDPAVPPPNTLPKIDRNGNLIAEPLGPVTPPVPVEPIVDKPPEIVTPESVGLQPSTIFNKPVATEVKTSPIEPIIIKDGPKPIIPADRDDLTGFNLGDQVPDPQKNVDNGSDPYVSNGQTTIPIPTAPNTPVTTGSATGLQGARANTQAQSTAQDQAAFALKQDWRVRLSLAPNSGYLYNALNVQGILQPLIKTNGVVFPYTPSIQVQYSAHYDNYDLTHSNYKIYQYKNSSVDTIQISCDFTAQDTAEANYLLAVIHFFKSVTKMFYGQDSIPKIGTPPPLCFLTGLGSFQFDNHPLAITNFAYNLPTDVDYIRASASATTAAGVNKAPAQPPNNTNGISNGRLTAGPNNIATGGVTPNPNFQQTTIQTPSASSRTPTYVPTKMTIAVTAVPIVTRNDISNRFSLRDYATGKLLQGKQNATVGIW
jgi:hypothetical protein